LSPKGKELSPSGKIRERALPHDGCIPTTTKDRRAHTLRKLILGGLAAAAMVAPIAAAASPAFAAQPTTTTRNISKG